MKGAEWSMEACQGRVGSLAEERGEGLGGLLLGEGLQSRTEKWVQYRRGTGEDRKACSRIQEPAGKGE